MTAEELDLLKRCVDKTVLLTRVDGRCYAKVLFVFDEGETPDVFYVEMERGGAGVFVEKGPEGFSTLLSDLVSVEAI